MEIVSKLLEDGKNTLQSGFETPFETLLALGNQAIIAVGNDIFR
jgi:hypothetical protein